MSRPLRFLRRSAFRGSGAPPFRRVRRRRVLPSILQPRYVQRINRRVNKLLRGVEKKFHDVQPISQTPTNTTGVVLNITDLDEGDTSSTRTGEKVTCKSLYFKGEIAKHASATSTKVRIFLARQKNNQVPAINGILQSGTINAPYNVEFKKLVEVFNDRTFIVDATTPKIQYNYMIPKEFQISFSGAAGTDLGSNSVYLCMISSEATNTPTVSGYSRMLYTDL